jgi:hypothetical protein
MSWLKSLKYQCMAGRLHQELRLRGPSHLGYLGCWNKGAAVAVSNFARTKLWLSVAAAAVLLLIAPALWNDYPLLQLDTGGYLARWYEGYLVPNRSTLFGLYLHAGETSHFWLDVALQSAVTVWIVQLILTRFGLAKAWQLAIVFVILCAVTALPFLASTLAPDIFGGLAILAMYLIVFHDRTLSRWQIAVLLAVTAFAAASHNMIFATMLVMCGLGWAALPFLDDPHLTNGLAKTSLAIVAGAIMLVLANYHFSGRMAWTPGATGITFGRMLQDGIVTRYLNDHCPDPTIKLCPYRDQLPATADQFLWGKSAFDQLGRFEGLGDEMQMITANALVDYPGLQITTAARAMAKQLTMVASGEGIDDEIAHTYAIFDRYLSSEEPTMRLARQQKGQLDFDLINKVDVPVALASLGLLVAFVGRAAWQRNASDLTTFATIVAVAILINALISGAISGPHDSYGARTAWLSTLVIMVACLRQQISIEKRSGHLQPAGGS